METMPRKTSRKAQVSMGRWCKEWFEKDEAYEVGWTQVQDRHKWKDIAEKAKNLPEL